MSESCYCTDPPISVGYRDFFVRATAPIILLKYHLGAAGVCNIYLKKKHCSIHLSTYLLYVASFADAEILYGSESKRRRRGLFSAGPSRTYSLYILPSVGVCEP